MLSTRYLSGLTIRTTKPVVGGHLRGEIESYGILEIESYLSSKVDTRRNSLKKTDEVWNILFMIYFLEHLPIREGYPSWDVFLSVVTCVCISILH